MARFRGLLAVGFAAVFALAGCLDLSGGSFDVEAAPVWQAGYSWTYDVQTVSRYEISSEGRSGSPPPEMESARVTFSIFNTTEPFDGLDVYYGRWSESVDGPIPMSPVVAITKDDLVVVGEGGYYGMAVPRPMPPVADSPGAIVTKPLAHEYGDPCADRTPIWRTESEEEFPQLKFPLRDGAQVSGTLGEDEDFAMRFTTRVDGKDSVEVPAGRFDAVHIVTEFAPATQQFSQDEGALFEFRARLDQWYSPEARYMVKTVTSAEVRALGFGGESFRGEFSSSMLLSHYSLSPEAPEPAPYLPSDYHYAPPSLLGIVPDTQFPVNVADGPTEVSMSLVESTGSSKWMGSEHSTNPSPNAKASPLKIDPETHVVVWSVTHRGAEETVEYHEGDVLRFNLTKGGVYFVNANVHSIECGEPDRGYAYATFSTVYEDSFTYSPGMGMAKRGSLGEFPVDGYPVKATVSWYVDPAYAVPLDEGEIRIVNPYGQDTQTYDMGSNDATFQAYPGLWTLEWETTRPSVGDEVTVDLFIDYGTSRYH